MSTTIQPYPPRLLTLGELQQISLLARKHVIEMLVEAGSGHSAGSLGMADVFTAMYFQVLKHSPRNPDWDERDRLILSNGHICPIWYVALSLSGYFDVEELKTLRKLNSRLQGHPHLGSLPGIENTAGPLGQGLSQAAGLALGFKMDAKPNRVYCLMSDGEQQEGQNWEAYMFAGARRLNNLTVLIDRNNIQIDGFTEDIMPLQPFKHKLEAFRWNVLDIDGHNIEHVIDACNQAKSTQEQPTAIICNTIPGKGVDFMENMVEWHGQSPDKKQAREALDDLRTLQGRIWWE
ncbi:MAG: transketolase [Microgenomates group bacterium]